MVRGRENKNVYLKEMRVLCLIGTYGPHSVHILDGISSAAAFILKRLHTMYPHPNTHLTAQERNRVIRARAEAGESQADLARIFNLSYQRVHQIIHGKHH